MAKLPERDLQTLWNRLKDVYEYFKSRGIPDKIIAGILGNASREGSGFWDNVTNSIKDKEGKIHYFYGGVLNELVTYDWVNTNYGGYTKQHQIQYIADGILGKLPEIKSDRGRLLNSRFNRFMNKASKSNSPSEIAAYWESIYEVAGKSKLDERQQCAEYFYKLMQKSNSRTKPSNKLNKSKSLPNWANPDFSKAAQSVKNPYYNFTSENAELDYPTYNLDNVKTEFDLPVYASNFKKGGKLIKKGQQGVKLHKTIYLKKDGNEPESPHSELKSWITGITPEERMDLTVQELSNGLSTYQPTKEQKRASEGIYHPKRITDWLGLVPVVLPAAITAGVTLPEWGPAALTTVTNPTFWGELIKDTGTYIVADAASQGLTGKRVGAHVNNAIGLEEDHPVGEFIGFGGTSMLRRPIQLMGKTTYQSIRGAILPEYALSLTMDLTLWKPYVSRVVGENGKIRLRLPSHSDKMPREIVLEPLGNNKFYVHIRTWDGEKIPASLSERDKGYLYEALYNELPEGAEILFPESGPGNYATRGTVAGLQRLARDPRFSKGSPGTLLYIDKDGSIKEFTGTSFIKNTSLLPQTLYIPTVSDYNNAPSWTPISKDWAAHSTDNIKVVETRNGVDLLLYNKKNLHIGGLSLQDMGNGQFDVIMINSTYPGGSGPLYNAGIKYGLLKYGDQFKGIRSGDSLVFPEKTLNVTNKFPRYQVGNRGAHIYGLGEFRFGPVHMLTGESTYYPLLKLPRYAIIPKNAEQVTDDMWNWAFSRALYEGNIKEARRLFDLHFKINAGKYPTTQGGDIKSLFRGEPMDFNSFKDTGVWLTDDSKYALNYTIDPYDFAPVPYRPLVQRYYVKGQEEQILPKKILSDLPDGPDKEFLWKLIADDLMRNITSNFNGYPEYVREEIGEETFPHFDPEWLGGTSAKRYRLGTADIISGHDKPMIPEGIYKNWIPSKGTEYLVRNPNYVKSAKLVTYDDNGEMIPLSKRHNFTINDRRFNKGGKLKIK